MLAPDPVKISIDLPENTYYIYMAACGGRDQIVSQISHDGWLSYEKPLPNLISRLVRSQRTSFLDIGANTGYYSLLAAVLGSVEVRAYEPVPQICEVMKCNIIHTFKTKFYPITVWSLALSNSNGKGELFVPDPSHGLIETSSSLNSGFKKIHAYNLQIDKTTIDSHLKEFPLKDNTLAVLKLDVESHEPEVLQGATHLIGTRRPVILAEILPGPRQAWFQNWADQHGYDHYALDISHGATKSQQVTANSENRDHLFAPNELPIEYILKDLLDINPN